MGEIFVWQYIRAGWFQERSLTGNLKKELASGSNQKERTLRERLTFFWPYVRKSRSLSGNLKKELASGSTQEERTLRERLTFLWHYVRESGHFQVTLKKRN